MEYSLEKRILTWLLTSDNKGMSSEAMAAASVGLFNNKNHPHDPSDFNRCLLLIDEVPKVREKFKIISSLSPTWKKLIDRWDELESTFIGEVGKNWCKGIRAPKTYALIKSIID